MALKSIIKGRSKQAGVKSLFLREELLSFFQDLNKGVPWPAQGENYYLAMLLG